MQPGGRCRPDAAPRCTRAPRSRPLVPRPGAGRSGLSGISDVIGAAMLGPGVVSSCRGRPDCDTVRPARIAASVRVCWELAGNPASDAAGSSHGFTGISQLRLTPRDRSWGDAQHRPCGYSSSTTRRTSPSSWPSALGFEGFATERRRHGPRGARRGGGLSARPHRPRRDAPRPRRLRGAPAACARRPDPRAGDLPHRPRRHRGQGPGPDASAATTTSTKPFSIEELIGPGAGGAATHRAAGTGDAELRYADLELDEDAHQVWRGGRADRADAHRVQAAALPAGQRRAGAHPGPDPRPRVGVRLRRRRQRGRDLHQLPAPQDRPRWSRRSSTPSAASATRSGSSTDRVTPGPTRGARHRGDRRGGRHRSW